MRAITDVTDTESTVVYWETCCFNKIQTMSVASVLWRCPLAHCEHISGCDAISADKLETSSSKTPTTLYHQIAGNSLDNIHHQKALNDAHDMVFIPVIKKLL